MRRFLFLLIVGVAGIGILAALGTWQLRRSAWKQQLLADITASIDEPPVALPDNPEAATDRYLPVTVSGIIGPGEVHVLTSRGEFGPVYRIIAPLETDEGRRILLGRGAVATPDKDRPRLTGPVTVTGNLDWPRETDNFTPVPDIAANIWFARDVRSMARALDTEPVLLVARSKTDPNVTPMPVTVLGIPDNHLQYAITWFSLALIWGAMTVLFLRRERAQPPELKK